MQGQVRPVQRVPRLLHGRGGLQDPQPPGVHLTGLPASSHVGWLGSLSEGLPRAGCAGRPAPGGPSCLCCLSFWSFARLVHPTSCSVTGHGRRVPVFSFPGCSCLSCGTLYPFILGVHLL